MRRPPNFFAARRAFLPQAVHTHVTWRLAQLFPELTIPHISGGGGALVSVVERGVAPRSCVEPRIYAGLLDADVLRDGSGAPGQSGWMVST